MKAKGGYVYTISNVKRNVLHIEVTSDLFSRIYQHRKGNGSVFTRRYDCKYLLYFEFHKDIESAIKLEKQMKKWKREWKEKLILEFNPEKRDLFDQVEDYR